MKKMPKTQNVYFLLFSLYWAQGLPVGFMTHALPVILRAEGVSLSLLSIYYSKGVLSGIL